jgi:uncharacterized DUF497 family protein
MIFDWDDKKSAALKIERGISFEDVIVAIEDGKTIDILNHPNQLKYKGQLLIVIEVNNYAFVVPAVKDNDTYFLKTIFPSRKYTDRYLPSARRKNEK